MEKLRWLVKVRQKLLNINYLAHKNGRPYRKFLFKKPLKLDYNAWMAYHDEGYTPLRAVREDLGLPIIEFKKHTIIF